MLRKKITEDTGFLRKTHALAESAYETKTKPALRKFADLAGGKDLKAIKAAIDAAAKAGATKKDLMDAIGGADQWNKLIRRLKKSRVVEGADESAEDASFELSEESETDAEEFARLMKKHWRTVKFNPKTGEGEVHMPYFTVKFHESGSDPAVVVTLEWKKPLGNLLKSDAKTMVKNLNRISDIMGNTSL